mmetsp:Transcript_39257/g.58313  ORF Transcript_39257/g.58313 Transcript_39257/m.58313 type:complete len:130 (-) Transcript_39257:16-405(-)
MMQGSRNLDEITRYEGMAGRNEGMIWQFGCDLGGAIDHLHTHRTIHGDIKPRNIIRAKGDLKLIDLDAAVEEGGSLTEKFSGAFLPPSIAREKFKPKETLEEVDKAWRKLRKERDLLEEKEDTEEEFSG